MLVMRGKADGRTEEAAAVVAKRRKIYDVLLVMLLAWMFVLGPLVALFILLPQARDRLLDRIWQAAGQVLG